MMKIGVIGTVGGWSSERLADAVAQETGFRLLIEMEAISVDLATGQAWHGNDLIDSLDALIIKKIGARYSPDLLDRLELLRFLAVRGLPVFSDPDRLMRVINRLTCSVTLRAAGIPMPPTTITEDIEQAIITVEEYGEAVVKPLFTSKARGMLLVRSGPGLGRILEQYREKNRIMYIQKKVELGNRDLGIVFLGGRYLTTYARCKQNDAWNTTTASGGHYQSCQPDDTVIALAHRAQELFGLDFTCVDVAESPEGPYVFEVSAFGGFRGIVNTSAIDPAALFVSHVMEKLTRDSRTR